MSQDPSIRRLDILVEGDLDEIVVLKIFSELELQVGGVYGKRGKPCYESGEDLIRSRARPAPLRP